MRTSRSARLVGALTTVVVTLVALPVSATAAPDLAVHLTAPTDASKGSLVDLHLTVTNVGGDKSETQELTVTVTPDVTLAAASGKYWKDCTSLPATTITCVRNETLHPSKSTHVLTLTVSVPADATATQFTTDAAVKNLRSREPETILGNNTAKATTTIDQPRRSGTFGANGGSLTTCSQALTPSDTVCAQLDVPAGWTTDSGASGTFTLFESPNPTTPCRAGGGRICFGGNTIEVIPPTGFTSNPDKPLSLTIRWHQSVLTTNQTGSNEFEIIFEKRDGGSASVSGVAPRCLVAPRPVYPCVQSTERPAGENATAVILLSLDDPAFNGAP